MVYNLKFTNIIQYTLHSRGEFNFLQYQIIHKFDIKGKYANVYWHKKKIFFSQKGPF